MWWKYYFWPWQQNLNDWGNILQQHRFKSIKKKKTWKKWMHFIENVTWSLGILLLWLKIFSLQFAVQRADKGELSSWSGLSGQSVTLDINPEQWKVGEGITSFNPALHPASPPIRHKLSPTSSVSATQKSQDFTSTLENNVIVKTLFLKC